MMLKFKITKKEMKQYSKIIGVGYCKLGSLLEFKEPFAYSSSNSNGWQCDYYDIDGVIISTGYNPLKSKGTSTNRDINKKYNDKAREICLNNNLSCMEQKEEIEKLLNKYIEEVAK